LVLNERGAPGEERLSVDEVFARNPPQKEGDVA
jgi:hypothetical protein